MEYQRNTELQRIKDVAGYRERFEESVAELSAITYHKLPDPEVRVKEVEDLVESYYDFVGDYPDSMQLFKLSNYILSKELKDMDVDKVTNAEFPFLSEYQLKRRERKQVSMEADNMDFLESKFNKGLDSLAKTPIKRAVY